LLSSPATGMLRTKASDRLGDFLMKFLPADLCTKAFGLFGLKVPTSPENLAGCIIEMTRSLMRQLEETIAKLPEALKKDVAITSGGDASEILCALYAQAVAALGEHEPSDEQAFFQIYTAKTFAELLSLLGLPPEAEGSFRELAHETSDLYFNNHPSLAELAQEMPEYAYAPEVEKVRGTNDWMSTFSLKAQIRVLGKMRISNAHLSHPLLKIVIATAFLHSMKFFVRLRPVLEGVD
jgi:hypothetical protein